VIVAVVSGKGGTGKTTVATSLARAWAREGPVLLADCDTEGPNAHHFLPALGTLRSEVVSTLVPTIDESACDRCGACSDVCLSHALAVLPAGVVFVESLCRSCGACALACPIGAISERLRPVGLLHRGRAGDLQFLQGVLNVGEARAIPVVSAVLNAARAEAPSASDIVLDGPPGASCPVAQVVQAADVCLLVTEPTPFGLHDLEQIYQLIALRDKPAAVVLNRALGGDGDRMVADWCSERHVPLLQSIPDRRSIAEGYARGLSLLDSLAGSESSFLELRRLLQRLAVGGTRGEAA
jgi:MinD superfamily P-loop ATPase